MSKEKRKTAHITSVRTDAGRSIYVTETSISASASDCNPLFRWRCDRWRN